MHNSVAVRIWILAACLIAGQTRAQRIAPSGVFLEDSLAIGREVGYALRVRYPVSFNVLFPDSTFDYSPFELLRREYFRTVSDTAQSVDSAVYYLTTFEVDSVQHIQLPVYVVDGVDCTAVYTKPDSVFLEQMIDEMPGEPELRSDTAFQRLRRMFNYPLAALVAGVVLVTVAVILLLFGKRILRWWRIRRIERRHKRFTASFFELMRNVSSNNPSTSPEHVLAVWKRYIERLDNAPVSKMTTKEINAVYGREDLRDQLRAIDRIIYAGTSDREVFRVFDDLMQFAVDRYQHRIRALRHG